MDSDPSYSVEPITERIIKKIPGKIIPLPKESEAFLKDLKAKSMVDLKELLERQNRILTNKSLLNKLADKGSKAAALKARIEDELKSRNEVDKATNLLSEMTLGQLNALEWTGHRNPGQKSKTSLKIENEDLEETDPLKIIASHSGTIAHKKQISFINPEESLIKSEDLADCEDPKVGKYYGYPLESVQAVATKNLSEQEGSTSSCNSTLSLTSENGLRVGQYSDQKAVTSASLPFSSLLSISSQPEPYAHFICEHYGHKEGKDRFKPNKPLKPFSGTFPLKPPGRISSKPKRWEETNVTPPVSTFVDAKLLSLEESIDLQREQNQKLKEVQMKHAAERLSSMHGIPMTTEIPASVLASMAYRGPTGNSDSEEEMNDADLEDQEHHDEDQKDCGTTVVYNIES